MKQLLILPFLAAPAFADCPAAPDISVAATVLLERAQAAPNEGAAQGISGQLWELWATAPDEQAQALLDRGMAARSSYNFIEALDAFDRLTQYCPDYAEGYNQRAFVNFLRQDFENALVDLDRALERSPRHVAAISGKALTLMGLGRNDEAQVVLRQAVELNPWISERSLLVEQPGQKL